MLTTDFFCFLQIYMSIKEPHSCVLQLRNLKTLVTQSISTTLTANSQIKHSTNIWLIHQHLTRTFHLCQEKPTNEKTLIARRTVERHLARFEAPYDMCLPCIHSWKTAMIIPCDHWECTPQGARLIFGEFSSGFRIRLENWIQPELYGGLLLMLCIRMKARMICFLRKYIRIYSFGLSNESSRILFVWYGMQNIDEI